MADVFSGRPGQPVDLNRYVDVGNLPPLPGIPPVPPPYASYIGDQPVTPTYPAPTPQRLAVQYLEKWPEYFKARGRDDATEFIRGLLVSWERPSTWRDAWKDLLGYPIMVQSANGGRYISRYTPAFFPIASFNDTEFELSRPYCYCTSIADMHGLDRPIDNITKDQVTGLGRWQNAFIEAVYETLTYDIAEDGELVEAGFVDPNGNPDEYSALNARQPRYITVLPNPSSSYQVLPAGSYVLHAGVTGPPAPPPYRVATVGAGLANGSPYPGTPGRIELECDLSVTWHHIPTVALGDRSRNRFIANFITDATGAVVPYNSPITDCLGCVNLDPFLGSPRGTHLLTAVVIKPVRSPLGSRLWDVEMRFRRFEAKSATIGLSSDGNYGYAYGHNLVFSAIANPPGYYEITPGSTVALLTTSNYLRTVPLDGYNIYNYRSFSQLFRVPQLFVDPGNT